MAPRFIVMSGLPASGKTTLGWRIGEALGLPVIDRDDLLEAAAEGAEGPVDRDALRHRADELLIDAVQRADTAVVIAFWRRKELPTVEGTPTEWLAALDDVVEVHCRCTPVVALNRFLERERHPVHAEDDKEPSDVLLELEAQALLGPLGVGRTVVVDLDEEPDLEAVLAEITSA